MAFAVMGGLLSLLCGSASGNGVDLGVLQYSACAASSANTTIAIAVFNRNPVNLPAASVQGLKIFDELPPEASLNRVKGPTGAEILRCSPQQGWPCYDTCGGVVTISFQQIDGVAANDMFTRVGLEVTVNAANGLVLTNLVSTFSNDDDPWTANNYQAGQVSVKTNCLVVGGVSPGLFSTSGGTPMSVLGSGFQSGASLTIGSGAVGVSSLTSTQIGATSPPLPVGNYDVTVTNPDGSSATLFNGYAVATSASLKYYTIPSCRVFDTRDASGSPALAPGQTRAFPIAGRCGIPSTAVAAAVNVTVIPSAAGYLSAFPGNFSMTPTSFITFSAGQVRSNNGVQLLATDGSGTLGLFNGTAGSVDVILDTAGYFR
jgi:hypothetical protein